jgi:hypothetical protein
MKPLSRDAQSWSRTGYCPHRSTSCTGADSFRSFRSKQVLHRFGVVNNNFDTIIRRFKLEMKSELEWFLPASRHSHMVRAYASYGEDLVSNTFKISNNQNILNFSRISIL